MKSAGSGHAARMPKRRIRCLGLTAAVAAVALAAAPAAFGVPPNDNVGNAIVVHAIDDGAQTNVFEGTTVNASKEVGEPSHLTSGNDPDPGGASVWYSWTPTYSADAAIALCSHNPGSMNFSPLLGVYSGDPFVSFQFEGSNDAFDCGFGSVDIQNNFTAQAGTTYRIAVDGVTGAQGEFLAGVFERAPNDDFSQAELLSGMTDSATGSNSYSDTETGEPGAHGQSSIWYRWKAPVTGRTTVDTCGSDFDTQLGVYRGTSVDALTLVAFNHDATTCGPQSKLSFNATKDTVYRIAVGGTCCPQTGAVSLHLSEVQIPQTTITAGPTGVTNDSTPTFKFKSSVAGSTYQCRFDGKPFAPCTGPGGSHTGKTALTQGAHTFYVRALKSGSPDPTPAKRTFTVDSAPPQTTITSGPTGTTHDATPTFGFSSNEAGSTFKCMLRTSSGSGAFGPCSGPGTTHTPNLPLANGSYVFSVRATDKAGNTDTSPASRAFTVN